MRQECRHLGGTERGGMLLLMEINVTLDPVQVSLLRAIAVVFDPQRVTYAVQQARPRNFLRNRLI